jgi:thermitase
MDRVVFEAFYVRVDGPPSRGSLAAARVRRALGRGTGIERLGDDGRGLLAMPKRRLAPGAAWQKARALQDELAPELGRTLIVEPLFAVTRRPTAATRRAKSGGGGGKPLPCADDCEWSLKETNVQRAWTLNPPAGGERMGKGILIGHPDTGYTRHCELFPSGGASRVRVDLGYDFEDGDPDPRDPLEKMEGHGTGTASVIMSDAGAQCPSTRRYVAGVAPAAELVPLRVSNGVVHFSFKDVTRAIHHAIGKSVHVISMSLGGPFGSKALEDAVDRAIASDIILLAAAGNVWPWVVYPARYDPVVAVAASNCDHHPWGDSAHGQAVDLSAPGESVWRARSTKTSSGVAYDVQPSSGTSYAVASVAGACALWLAFFGRDWLITKSGTGRLAALFHQQLRLTCQVPSGWKVHEYGAGILDALVLLQSEPTALARKRVRKARKIAPKHPADLVAGYFEPRERARALARLERRLGATPAARARAWARLGPELVFQVATDDDLRRRLAAPAPQGKAKAKGKAAAPVHVARGSSELRAVLEGA